MTFLRCLKLSLWAILSLVIFSQCQQETSGRKTGVLASDNPLETYISTRDPVFNYQLVHQQEGKGYRYFVLRVTSQNWLTENEVDETTWWHWVSFVLPDKLSHNTSLMMISGGSRNSSLPESPDKMLVEAALKTRSPAIKVHNIPFQPVTFKGDTVSRRTEDGLIAYGWRKFMENGARDEDAVWLARLPMTKAVMSAMDAVTDYTKNELGLGLETYVVAGGSKRGWTTWTTAAMDSRVVGMAPIVIDLLNIVPSFKHHWQAYGFWAPAVKDYEYEGIFDWMDTQEYQRLLEIVEPYSYLDHYTDMPKLLINASGDQFFLPDSWKFYWDDLKGEKHLAYIPNTGHSLDGSDAMQVLLGFYNRILNNEKRPEYSWEIKEDRIEVEVDPENPPVAIKLWEAHNESARDFRIDVLGPGWTSVDIPISANGGSYSIPVTTPEKGWKGHFVELTYGGGSPMKVTTGVKVLPEIYDYEPFQPKSPKGTLLEK
jgi:PhoPQ-activated pathogenicity-related protein